MGSMFYCLCKLYNVPFEVKYDQNISDEQLFKFYVTVTSHNFTAFLHPSLRKFVKIGNWFHVLLFVYIVFNVPFEVVYDQNISDEQLLKFYVTSRIHCHFT